MTAKHDVDVLVAGGGPVGLFTALVLARHGIRVEVLEEQWRSASRSYALALHPESLRLFGSLGLVASVLEHGSTIRTLGLYGEGRRQAEIQLSALPDDNPFVLVLPQHLLEGVLHSALNRAGVEIRWNHRLAGFEQGPDGIEARVEGLAKESSGYSVSRTEWIVDREEMLSAKFLVGADGHRSAVRRRLGIDFPSSGTPRTFAVFEFNSVGQGPNEMQIVLDEKATSVLWPLSEERFRWSFELPDFHENPDPRFKSRLFVQLRDEAFPHVSEEKLSELIDERAPWFEPKIVEVVWSAAVRFECRLAEHFGEGRVMLVGDAAHLALPIGVQSMNVGFREGMDLARRLVDIIAGKAGLDSLNDHATKWKQEWDRLLETTQTPSADDSASPWIRERVARIPPCIPASGEDLTPLLAQVGIRF
jgi:2-polyprenyl-6-methoxyphenol hydroxylase-like FAD-dependent oxidoreductase